MNINPLKITAFCLIGSTLILSGCNSTDSASSDTLTITSANATQTVASAVSSTSGVLNAVPVGTEVTKAPTAIDIVKLAEDLATNSSATTSLSTPTGVEDSSPCDGGNGSFSDNHTNTSTSRDGTITFTGCVFANVSLTGELNYSLAWSDPSGPYTYHFSGNVNATRNGIVTRIGNLDYTVAGDNSTGDYTVDPFNHSVSLTGGYGYTVSLLDPIIGNANTDAECPLTGTVLIVGARGTQAKGTIANHEVSIDFDDGSGTFSHVETVPCTEIFPVQRPFLLRS
jgi:hypothetical protein